MKKKLPEGFQSWIQFYDYLRRDKPELLKAKTIQFMSYQPQGGVKEEYSIRVETIERNSWREIQSKRLTGKQTDLLISALHNYCTHDNNDFFTILDFLRTTQKNSSVFDMLESMARTNSKRIPLEDGGIYGK
jgi:hypothetical protein